MILYNRRTGHHYFWQQLNLVLNLLLRFSRFAVVFQCVCVCFFITNASLYWTRVRFRYISLSLPAVKLPETEVREKKINLSSLFLLLVANILIINCHSKSKPESVSQVKSVSQSFQFVFLFILLCIQMCRLWLFGLYYKVYVCIMVSRLILTDHNNNNDDKYAYSDIFLFPSHVHNG